MAGLTGRRTLFKGSSRLCSRNVLVNGLRFVWIVVVIWCEVGTFFWTISRCRWPDKGFWPLASHEKPLHVMLIGDAQVRPPQADSSWLGSIRHFGDHSYLRKSWNVARRLNPHAVIFLGDMLASGRHVTTEEEYEQYMQKFREAFPLKPTALVYYLPGNEDVGLGVAQAISRKARRRYLKHFGPFNQYMSLRNHTFVLLDAPGLVEEDYQRAASSQGFDRWTPLRDGPIEFVKSIASDRRQPVILLSHIPLSRPETASCGPLRERGRIRRGVGHGYQTQLGKHTSQFLLENLRPSAVFSADDRDYCEYSHNMLPADPEATDHAVVKEVTVKSFSTTRHIRRPGFQLLSLVTPMHPPSQSLSEPHQQSFADSPCFLPSHRGIYTSTYIPFAIFTLLTLLIANFYQKRSPSLKTTPSRISLSPRTPPRINARGRTPIPPPGSPDYQAWSPISPFLPSDDSPHRLLPPSLRTPGLAPPTLRASSRPATPAGSPLLAPPMFIHEDDDHAQEDMHPTQYAMRRDRMYPNGDWSPGQDDDDHLSDSEEVDSERGSSSFFVPPSGSEYANHGDWSWTFVFRGRRRRLTLHRKSLAILQPILRALTVGSRRRRSVMRAVLDDVISVGWVIIVSWLIFGLLIG